MNPYETDSVACRGRQQRLLDLMDVKEIDLCIMTQHEHVQWLTGIYMPRQFQPGVALSADGLLTLVAPPKDYDTVAVDEVISYEAQWLSTMRNDQRKTSSVALLSAISDRENPRRIGVEFSSFCPHLWQSLNAELIDVEPDLYYLRRRKDADELAKMKKAIDATRAMYAVAREVIEPGINELDLFNQLQAAAVREFGEMLTGTGNDYRCNARGGSPRDHRIEAGELYILDLGPAFRGYYADNCRTISVEGCPSDVQLQAWEHVTGVFEIVQKTVAPGASCKELFEACNDHMKKCTLGVFGHHLGHGVGLFPHEAPHLNPNWDDTFEVGDVFAVEPGIYSPKLCAGMRLENNYLVTESGVELLTEFPLEL